MVFLGVDPGLSGAIAALDAEGSLIALADLPVIRDLSLAWIDGGKLHSLLSEAIAGRSCRATVERVSSMPGQGVASSFQFGVGFGSILSVLQVLEIPVELVTPGVWKRSCGLGKDKRAALDKARLLFPSAELSLAKHHGRAEALLLADFGRRVNLGLHTSAR